MELMTERDGRKLLKYLGLAVIAILVSYGILLIFWNLTSGLGPPIFNVALDVDITNQDPFSATVGITPNEDAVLESIEIRNGTYSILGMVFSVSIMEGIRFQVIISTSLTLNNGAYSIVVGASQDGDLAIESWNFNLPIG